MGWSLFGVLEEKLKGVPRGWQSKYPSRSMVNDSKRFADSGGWSRQYPIRPPITRFDAFSTRHLAVEFSIDRGCFDPLSLFRMKQTTWSVGIWDSQARDFGLAHKRLSMLYLGRWLSGSNSVGRMPASTHLLSYLSFTFICCLSCCPLRCGSQERINVPGQHRQTHQI